MKQLRRIGTPVTRRIALVLGALAAVAAMPHVAARAEPTMPEPARAVEAMCESWRGLDKTCAAADATLTPDLSARAPRPDEVAALRDHIQRSGGTADVIVVMRTRWIPDATLDGAAREAQRAELARLRTAILAELPAGGWSGLRELVTLPMFGARVDESSLDVLARSPRVAAIEVSDVRQATDRATNAAVTASTAQAVGATGIGWSVAVIDTGVQASHPYFGGRVAGGACYTAQRLSSDGKLIGDCPNGAVSQTGQGAGEPCTWSGACFHGTHVAGIAAGKGREAGNGVAPAAGILPIRAGSPYWEGCFAEETVPCLRFRDADVVSGLDHVTAQAGVRNIAAVNLSLGDGQFTSNCTNLSYQIAVDNARKAGVAVVSTTGNRGFRNAGSSPGCIPGVYAIGATDTQDVVWANSNASSWMAFWAPGVNVQSAYYDNAFADDIGPGSGTSMAAPHVAGAFAVLRSLAPNATVDELYAILRDTGDLVTDERTNGSITKPRLNLYRAVERTRVLGIDSGPIDTTDLVRTYRDSDFDGDRRKDYVTFRPSTGGWAVVYAKGGFGPHVRFGQQGDIPVPGDYTGDKRTDMAVFRPSEGRWYWRNTATGATPPSVWFGNSQDIPVPGDYDGDGTTDLGVFRYGTWYWMSPAKGTRSPAIPFGTWTDIPVQGDYDGDGKTDIAVYRPHEGKWYWKNSSNGATPAPVHFGEIGDVPVPGKWDSDAKFDTAVFRPRTGEWFYRRSFNGAHVVRTFGDGYDDPTAYGDTDMDGSQDRVFARHNESNEFVEWYVLRSKDLTTPSPVSHGYSPLNDMVLK